MDKALLAAEWELCRTSQSGRRPWTGSSPSHRSCRTLVHAESSVRPSRAAAASCGRVVAFAGRARLRRAVAGMEMVCRGRGEERSAHVLGAAPSVGRGRRAAAAMVVALAVELLAI